MIITLFGDAVLPRGGTVALSTVLSLFGALGIGANVVRTAMSRLTADGWIERSRVGRHSFYRLSDRAHADAQKAATQIYAAHGAVWDGVFQLVIGAEGAAGSGVATLAPGILVTVGAQPGLGPGLGIQLRAMTDPASARAFASQLWPPERLADSYRRFIAAFGPLHEALNGGALLTDLQAMTARLLLIHHYRRLVLREPGVPDALRPDDWPGPAARTLCATLYAALLPGSERWLDAAHTADGALPPPGPELGRRFSS